MAEEAAWAAETRAEDERAKQVEMRNDWLLDPATLAKDVGILQPEDAWTMFDHHFHIVVHKLKGRNPSIVRVTGTDEFMTFGGFKEAYGRIRMQVMVEVRGKQEATDVDAAAAWLNRGNSPRYLREVYYPVGANETATSDFASQRIRNTWQGFRARKLAGPWTLAMLEGTCPTIYEYLWTVVASRRQNVMEYIVKWIADAVQNPRRTAGRTAIVMRSEEEGSGKTTLAKLICSFYHRENTLPAARMKSFSGNFTGHFENKSIAGSNEVYFLSSAGKEAATAEATRSFIYDLIDNGILGCEHKGLGEYDIDNYCRLILSTNKSAAMPQGSQGRRFSVYDASTAKLGDRAFWGRFYEVLGEDEKGVPMGPEYGPGSGGELDRFFSILASVDLGQFNPQRDKPVTQEMARQAELTATGAKKWLIDILDRGELLWGVKDDAFLFRGGSTYIVATKMVRAMIEQITGHKASMTDTAFGREVMNVLAVADNGDCIKKDFWLGGKACSGRRFPELAQARALFEERCNNKLRIDWSNELTEWTAPTPSN